MVKLMSRPTAIVMPSLISSSNNHNNQLPLFINHKARPIVFTRRKCVLNRQEFNNYDRLVFGAGFTLLAICVCFTATILVYTGRVKILSPRNHVSLDTFSEKIEFAARYWVLGIFWLYITTHYVTLRRFFSKAINPLSGNESLVEDAVKINTNSVEQFFIVVVAQITVIASLKPDKIITMIPLMNALYITGRILFWMGYPKYRGFGMTMTMFPATLAMYFSLHKLFTHFLSPSLISWSRDI